MKNLAILLCLGWAIMASAPHASGHTVWIEPLGEQLVIRFAEPGNKFEKSPGHLDSLTAPVSFCLVTNAPQVVESPKKSDHFFISGAAMTNIVCTESIFSVRGGRKPYFYARWQLPTAGPGTPLLTLDLVPTGKTGEVRAFFRGEPLGNIKATLYTPDEKEVEIAADNEGILRFNAERPGRYILAIAHHREPIAGFHVARPYQQTSHNTALSWVEK